MEQEIKSYNNNLLKSALCFDTMLMPKIITFVYWLLLLGVLVGALGMMFNGNFLGGLIALPMGAVGVRLWCELMIVLFKINENIQKISDRAQ